ncbi:hypothetical protein AAHA92_32981 [Salvia divinorum]|uniref:Uncharacterized protein n=1 Tax=Salvia divinorum TaxID=28513 RepID=A0ABD1FMG8_SALDI
MNITPLPQFLFSFLCETNFQSLSQVLSAPPISNSLSRLIVGTPTFTHGIAAHTVSASLLSRLSSFSGPSSRAFRPFRRRAIVHPPSSHLQFRFAVAARSWTLHAAAAGQLAPPLLKLKIQNEISSSRIC